MIRSALGRWPKITLLGDSVTARSFDVDYGCWGAMLAHKVQPYFGVDNRGFDGYNSKWCLELMPKLFSKSYLEDVRIFVPFVGHNDCWDGPPLRIEANQFDSNMRGIVKYLLTNGLKANQIIMITPTWYHEPDFTKFVKSIFYPPVQKDAREAQQYADIVKEIAHEHGTHLIDFFKTSYEYEPLNELFCDGCHLSTTGARVFFDQLWPVIKQEISQQYGKPMESLYHVIPVDKHPEVEPILAKYMESKGVRKK